MVGEERTDGETVVLSGNGVLLALDRVEPGFNPHLLADQGWTPTWSPRCSCPARSSPVPTAIRSSTVPWSRRSVLGGDRDTVRYTIDQKAQWSDGVPVAAEDFEYLWRQMTTQPGVVDPAGYERIVAVRSGAGGKIVDVEFDSPPQQWQSLFTNLVPGHTKNAPAGFQGAMAGLPVTSAGPFMIRVADIGRVEIEFVRNDRYWAQAPGLDQILVRRATGPVSSVRPCGAVPVRSRWSRRRRSPRCRRHRVGADGARRGIEPTRVGPEHRRAGGRGPHVRRGVAAAVDPEVVGRIVTGESAPSVTSFPVPSRRPPRPRPVTPPPWTAPSPGRGSPGRVRDGSATAAR